MKVNANELKAAPEVMNKEQLRKLCHISKRTALFLLESGLLPSTNTGKKTKCYKILKSDVVIFISDKENNPSKYIPPERWYTRSGSKQSFTVRVYPHGAVSKERMKGFYTNNLSQYPDVMTTKDVVEFTGYVRQSVMHWVDIGQLQILTKTNTFHIPKVFLIKFLCSDYYNGLVRKTEKHMNALWQMSR